MTLRAVPAGALVPGRSNHDGFVGGVEARQGTAPGRPGWGLGGGPESPAPLKQSGLQKP